MIRMVFSFLGRQHVEDPYSKIICRFEDIEVDKSVDLFPKFSKWACGMQ